MNPTMGLKRVSTWIQQVGPSVGINARSTSRVPANCPSASIVRTASMRDVVWRRYVTLQLLPLNCVHTHYLHVQGAQWMHTHPRSQFRHVASQLSQLNSMTTHTSHTRRCASYAAVVRENAVGVSATVATLQGAEHYVPMPSMNHCLTMP